MYSVSLRTGKNNASPRNYRTIGDGIVRVRMRDVCVIQFTFCAELIYLFLFVPSFLPSFFPSSAVLTLPLA